MKVKILYVQSHLHCTHVNLIAMLNNLIALVFHGLHNHGLS